MILFSAMMGMMTLIVGYDIGLEEGYRKGQIDALTGTVKYEQVLREAVTTWEEIK